MDGNVNDCRFNAGKGCRLWWSRESFEGVREMLRLQPTECQYDVDETLDVIGISRYWERLLGARVEREKISPDRDIPMTVLLIDGVTYTDDLGLLIR
jgi:hypothetical protein